MDIVRTFGNPESPTVGAAWETRFIDLEDPTAKFAEFKDIVEKEIMSTIHNHGFDGFTWRKRPDLSVGNEFDTKFKITQFYARVNYFRIDRSTDNTHVFTGF